MAEKEVEAGLVKAIYDLGGQVDEFSQRRRSKCKCGEAVYAGTQQTPGIPDLRAVFPSLGLTFWLEVKYGSNRPTQVQTSWMQRECKLGTLAVPVWGISDLLYVLNVTGVLPKEPVPPDVSNLTLFYVGLWMGSRA